MTPFVRDNLRLSLEGKKILLGVSGSIAAFKACDIVRGLKDCGAEVRVVLTAAAEKFVTRVTLETLSGNPVATSLWDEGHGTHHIEAARWADLALIAPATANTIAKLALGQADDLLSTELLAFQGPVLLAPAMNPAMFAHAAVQQNVATLASRGTQILGPVSGLTSCGEEGLGRMLEPAPIIEQVARSFYAASTGKHVVITLGPTRSPLDPVRYLSNRSSGLMGASLCWAAARAGYRVTAVCGPTTAELPLQTTVIAVQTAAEMAAHALNAWSTADVFIAAAAVLDWDVANPQSQKLKKEKGEFPKLEFTRNLDILAEAAARRKPGQFVLGFAAETEAPLRNGQAKLAAKGCDAIFINDVSRPDTGFESTTNAGWWLSRDGETAYEFQACSKPRLARALLALIEGHGPGDIALPLSLGDDQHLNMPSSRNFDAHLN